MFRFIQELRRRSVFRVVAGYLVASWLVLQVVAAVENAAGLPPWVDGGALILLIAGFPLAIFLSWAFELTPEGLKPTPSLSLQGGAQRKPVRAVDIVLFSALTIVCGLAVWQLVSRPAFLAGAPAGDTVALVTPAGETPVLPPEPVAPELSVAVLPFVAFSSFEDDGYIADGLTEEILNSLAAVPELLVTSRTSAFQFRGPDLPSIPEIAQSLGVAHILEGSVRRSGDQLRVTVQLIRASDDRHLWSQTFDRSDNDVFAIQEEIAENVARVMEIVLNEDQRRRMQNSGTRSFEAFIAFQQALTLWEDAHSDADFELLEEADPLFAQATALAPDFSQAYLLQSDQFSHDLVTMSESDEPIDEAAYLALENRRVELLESAMASASTPAEVAIIEANSLLFSDDWSGARRVIDDALAAGNCANDNWMQTLMVFHPDAEARADYGERLVACDPLNPDARYFQALNLLERQNYEAALAASVRLRDIGASYESEEIELDALLGLERYEEADAILGEDWIWERYRYNARRGDAEALEADYEILVEDSEFLALIANAIAGRRDDANAIASRIDARPLGSVTLVDIVMGCGCGAPFDLEAAPNFARRMRDSGLNWPPASDRGFPLMDD